MTRHFFSVCIAFLLFLLGGVMPGHSQSLDCQLNVDGFIDNSEGDDTYRSTMTHIGLGITPTLSFTSRDQYHTIVGGWNGLIELGDQNGFIQGRPVVYYQYQTPALRFLFGSISRSLLHEQLPDYLICDSIRYYRPVIMGFDFLYNFMNGYAELFLDWIQTRTQTDREQFMVGIDTRFQWGMLQAGLNGYYYHYALEKNGLDMGHHIHDNLVVHPFLGFDLSRQCFLDSLYLRTGVLFQADRDRVDDQWHVPVGFMGELYASWQRLAYRQTFYRGARQQVFGNEGFGKYYWGDTYVQSPWYSRTDISYDFIHSRWATVSAQLTFHVTNAGLNWHQLLTVRCPLGGNLLKKW